MPWPQSGRMQYEKIKIKIIAKGRMTLRTVVTETEARQKPTICRRIDVQRDLQPEISPSYMLRALGS
jgi:phage portal protein BeeE